MLVWGKSPTPKIRRSFALVVVILGALAGLVVPLTALDTSLGLVVAIPDHSLTCINI